MTLTSEQEAVVSLASGRHLVLAPPGSGKTEMLSQRVLRALKAGVKPERMLCATFTNRAAYEMRDRVNAVGDGLALPDVGNLHHFCHRFLMSVGRLHPGKTVLDESQQLDFICEVVDVLAAELRNGADADLRRTHGVSVTSAIKGLTGPQRIELNGLLQSVFAKYASREKSPYPDILAAVQIVHQWRLGIPSCYVRRLPPGMLDLFGCGIIRALEPAYSGLKRKFRAVDFDDLVNETYLYLVHHPLPDERRFTWVQVDEVQDLNPLQWRIVRELTAERAVSVFFGDVEQSIFSFLGASVENFSSEVMDCERHYFRTNFRATPLLLEILMRYSLVQLQSEWNFLPMPAEVGRRDGEVTMSGETSDAAVVRRVRALLASGTAENVAILVRKNGDADHYEQLVRKLGYRYAKVSGLDLFAYAPMRDFLAFVSLLGEKPSMSVWTCLVRHFVPGIFRNSDARYFVRQMFASRFDPLSLFGSRSPVPIVPIGGGNGQIWAWRHSKQLTALRSNLAAAYGQAVRRLDARVSFRELFADFAKVALGDRQLYSLRTLVSEKRLVELEMKRELTYEEARQRCFERMEKFLRYADSVYDRDARPLSRVLAEDWQTLTKLKEADLLVGDEKIVISTIHKAKGRQFDAVVVPSAEDVVAAAVCSDLEEAKRLLYVAMSRAKRHLSLFGCSPGGACDGADVCFRPGYVSYYVRKSKGESVAGDWLNEWERLAESRLKGEFAEDLVEAGLVSRSPPVVRMAMKALVNCGDEKTRRMRYLGFLRTTNADVAIAGLRDVRVYDTEAVRAVRVATLEAKAERVHCSSLSYFRSVLDAKPCPGSTGALALAALGDFIYNRRGEIRLEASLSLKALGDGRWEKVVTGAAKDFERLAQVPDPDHEDSIRAILQTKPGGEYEKSLRDILCRRAKSVSP